MSDLDVKRIRKKLGITQTEFAEIVAVSLKTIQNWEAGGKIPATKDAILRKLMRDGLPINNQQGENIYYNNATSEQLDKALDEIAEQRKLYAVQMEKAQSQIDKLISIIEKTK